jgi:hypothetical protein
MSQNLISVSHSVSGSDLSCLQTSEIVVSLRNWISETAWSQVAPRLRVSSSVHLLFLPNGHCPRGGAA